jgi:outer membrane protein
MPIVRNDMQKRSRSYIFRITPPLLLLSFVCISCSRSIFIDPYSLAPKAYNQGWSSDKKESKKINEIEINDTLRIPKAGDTLSLGDLFDISLFNSPNTHETWETARSAAAQYVSSLSTYFPSLTFDAEVLTYKLGAIYNNAYFANTATAYGPEVQLSYLIWDSGERSANAEVYYQALQEANWSHSEEIQSVMKKVATDYYNYLSTKATLEAYKADLYNAEESYQAAKDKNVFGIFDETDVLQAKTNYLQKKVQVTGQIAATKNAFVYLLDTLGIPCDVDFNLGLFPKDPPLDPFKMNANELVQIALKTRPELKAAKAELLSKEAAVSLAKTQLLPQINLTAEGGNQWYNGGYQDKGNYMVELSLTFPIFTGFYYRNQILAAEANLKKSVATVRAVELSTIREVRTSYNNFEMSKEQLVDTLSYLQAAEIEFTAMMDRYKLGIVDILDLLSSQAYLADARAQYVNSQKEFYTSIIDVAFATGMLTNSCPWTMEGEK